MNIQLIIAAVIAASSFLGGWTIQSWRYGAKEKDRVEQELVDQRNAATTAIRRTETVIQAQSAATVRDAALRRDAAGARDESDRLRTSRDEAVRIAAASHNACLERIDAFSVVLGTVEAAGREVAAQADRLHSDRQTLIDAWPR